MDLSSEDPTKMKDKLNEIKQKKLIDEKFNDKLRYLNDIITSNEISIDNSLFEFQELAPKVEANNFKLQNASKLLHSYRIIRNTNLLLKDLNRPNRYHLYDTDTPENRKKMFYVINNLWEIGNYQPEELISFCNASKNSNFFVNFLKYQLSMKNFPQDFSFPSDHLNQWIDSFIQFLKNLNKFFQPFLSISNQYPLPQQLILPFEEIIAKIKNEYLEKAKKNDKKILIHVVLSTLFEGNISLVSLNDFFIPNQIITLEVFKNDVLGFKNGIPFLYENEKIKYFDFCKQALIIFLLKVIQSPEFSSNLNMGLFEIIQNNIFQKYSNLISQFRSVQIDKKMFDNSTFLSELYQISETINKIKSNSSKNEGSSDEDIKEIVNLLRVNESIN